VMGSASDTKGLCRVVVPEGVALVADDGAENTFIVGAKAEPAEAWLALDGCGTNSVRGAYLKNNASLRGFTVTGGYGRCYVGNSGTTGEYGGGILCADSGASPSTVGRVFDCVITNNYAWGGAGAHCGAYVRCKFLYNRSQLGYRVGLTGTPGCAINCYFNGQSSPQTVQGHITDINSAVNCTFDGTIPGVRTGGYATKCYNCIFKANPSMTSDANNVGNAAEFWNCRAPQEPTAAKAIEKWNLEGCGNEVVAAEELELDSETHAPAAKGLATVDSAVAWGLYTDNVASVISEAEYALDLNGDQRVYGAKLDVGAAEYDWRGDFAMDISGGRLFVAAATPGVAETAEKGVSIGDGESVGLAWPDSHRAPSPRKFRFAVQGGVLNVSVNGSAAAALTGDGTWIWEDPAVGDVCEFAYEGSGEAVVLGSSSAAGFKIIFR